MTKGEEKELGSEPSQQDGKGGKRDASCKEKGHRHLHFLVVVDPISQNVDLRKKKAGKKNEKVGAHSVRPGRRKGVQCRSKGADREEGNTRTLLETSA